MLNAIEATDAFEDIIYPATKGLSKEERLVKVFEYSKAKDTVKGQFKAWLANEYADFLQPNVQNDIWDRAWEYGHDYGYEQVENYYIDFAEFAQKVLNSTR